MQTCWFMQSLGAAIDVCEYDGYVDVVANGIYVWWSMVRPPKRSGLRQNDESESMIPQVENSELKIDMNNDFRCALWNVFRHGGSCCAARGWFLVIIWQLWLLFSPSQKSWETSLTPRGWWWCVLHWYDCHWAGRTIPRSRGAGWGAGLRPI